MPTTEQLVTQARSLAEDLRLDMAFQEVGGRAYWVATSPSGENKIRARTIAALDFIDRFAGRESQWAVQARDVYEKNTHGRISGSHALGEVLNAWAKQVETGFLVPRLAEAQGARGAASTDLMKQVRLLNEDPDVVPAAPIVLAGAALEIALRSAVEELDLELTERPSIGAYARRLRADDFLSRQDVKSVDQMSGMRNAAAHGLFDEIDRAQAGLLEQQVNMFLERWTLSCRDVLTASSGLAANCLAYPHRRPGHCAVRCRRQPWVPRQGRGYRQCGGGGRP